MSALLGFLAYLAVIGGMVGVLWLVLGREARKLGEALTEYHDAMADLRDARRETR